MTETLGCGSHVVEIRRLDRYTRDGEPITPPTLDGYFRLQGVQSCQFTRTWNAWAPFEIDLAGTTFCQDLLPSIIPNVTEVRILRGRDIAYTGIVRDIEMVAGRSSAKISGGDQVSEFAEDGGRLPNLVEMNYVDTDPVDIAYDIITRMMDMTSPQDIYLIRDYLYTNPVGEKIDFAPGITADYVIDTLDDLADYGLLYAAVGRRIILSSVADLDREPVATITTRDISGDVTVRLSSQDMAVLGVAVRDGDPPDIFTAGTFGSPYGMPAARVDVDDDVSDRTAAAAARRAIQGRTRPRYQVEMPRNARLLPHAALPLRNIRPGSARIDVEIVDIPVPIRQPMMLSEAEFRWVPDTETVSVNLAPIGEPVAIP